MWVLQVLFFVVVLAALSYAFRGLFANDIAAKTVEIISEDGIFRVRRFNVIRLAHDYLTDAAKGHGLEWYKGSPSWTVFKTEEDAATAYTNWVAEEAEKKADAERRAMKVVKKLS